MLESNLKMNKKFFRVIAVVLFIFSLMFGVTINKMVFV